MRVTPVAIADPPLLNAAGLHAPYALRTVVELDEPRGSDGDQRGARQRRGRRDARRDAGHRDRPRPLRSQRPSARGRAQRLSTPGPDGKPRGRAAHALSALEVACLDLQGKSLGVRVCDLLGGAVRERVPFSAYLFFKVEGAGGPLGFGVDTGASGWPAARQAEARERRGDRGAGAGDVRASTASSRSSSRAVPCPPSRRWRPSGRCARPSARACRSASTRTRRGATRPRCAGAARWRGCSSTTRTRSAARRRWHACGPKLAAFPWPPTCAPLRSSTFRGACAWAREDVILADHHGWGGLRPCVELGRICRTFGRGLSMHSNSHLGRLARGDGAPRRGGSRT